MKKIFLLFIGILMCYCRDDFIDNGEKPPEPLSLSVESLTKISPAGVHVTLMANAHGIIHGVVKSYAEPAPTKADIKSDAFKVEFNVSEDDQGVPVDHLVPRNKLANMTEAARYKAYFLLEKTGAGSSEIVSWEYLATNSDLILLGIISMSLSVESLSEISPIGVNVTLTANVDGIIHGVVKSSADPAPTKADIKSDALKVEFTVLGDDQGVPVYYLIPRNKLANITEATSYTAYFFLEKTGLGSSEVVGWEYTATNTDLILLGIISIGLSVGSLSEFSSLGVNVTLTANIHGIIYGVVKSSAEPAPTKAAIKSDALKVKFTVSENEQGVPARYLIPQSKLANITEVASYTAYFFLEKTGVGDSEIVSLEYTVTNSDLVSLGTISVALSVGSLSKTSPAGVHITLTASVDGNIYGVVKASADPAPTKAAIKSDALKVDFTVSEDDQGAPARYLIPRNKLTNITETASYTAYFFLEKTGVGDSEIVSWEYTATNTDLVLLGITTIADLISLKHSTKEINAILKELASRVSSVCSVSTEEAATRCLTVLPETVYDSSDRFTDRLPDQTDKYLIRIDASQVFEATDNLTYKIVSGNPTHTIHTTYESQDILYNLSGYRITSDGKLYPKDVFLLGRNRNKYWGEGVIFSIARIRDYGLFNKYVEKCPVLDNNGLPGCSNFFDDPSRYNHKGCTRVLDCSNSYEYHVDHTFLRTETNTLTIKVKNTSTDVTKTVVVNVYPTPSAFPVPVATSTPPPPASSDGVSCLSAKSKVIANCTVSLPSVAYDASPNFITGGHFNRFLSAKRIQKYLVRVDASGAFPSASRLSYQILSGNPHYSISNKGRIVNLNGYFINSEGEIYTKDVWLLGRNRNAYELDKDQLIRILFHEEPGFRGPFIERSRCRPVFDSEDIDCSGLHSFHFNYTFGKSESDTLVIRVTNQDTSEARDITVTINPNPRAVSLASECSSSDDLHEWGCINAAALIPERTLTTTDAMRRALPNGLALRKSKYELAAETEFDSFDEMENMFSVPSWFRRSDDFKIVNGKLQILIKPVPGSTNGKCGYSRPMFLDSIAVFEPNAGYLEYRVTKYPKITAEGGNAIMWSRYGVGNKEFWLDLPKRVVRSNGRKKVTRTDLGRLGFAEIDFLERWRHFASPYFVVHTYPQEGTARVNDIPIKDSISPGHYYKQWGAGTSNNDASGANTYSITYGMEISPGRLNDGRTVNFFKDGTRLKGIKYSSNSAISNYINGAAFRVVTISDIVIREKFCSGLRPTMIEMDYIRYYRPKGGY